MEQTNDITHLAQALGKAKTQFKKLRRNKVNPHFRSRYADLDACLDATEAALAANGLVVVQGATMVGPAQIGVTTQLIHFSGEWIREMTLLPVGAAPTPQSAGAAITYARRYGYSAVLGITPDDDDDAERAMQRPTGTAATAARAVPTQPQRPTSASSAQPIAVRPPNTHQ